MMLKFAVLFYLRTIIEMFVKVLKLSINTLFGTEDTINDFIWFVRSIINYPIISIQ